MLCAVYKSPKKADTFLYINKRDDFTAIPKALLDTFGPPQFVMLVPLIKRKNVAGISVEKLSTILTTKGFYLQLPPTEESLLSQHRRAKGLNSNPDKKF
ncbi:MAG: hypothetical protein ACI97K_003158 [Glaciecola sp.]|jgi:uncharacterized protein YcgL (UPF0745 family)